MRDERAKQPMTKTVLFTGNGFQVFKLSGNKDDYMDTDMPEGGIKVEEFPWVTLFTKGAWDLVHLESGRTWNLTSKDPYGKGDQAAAERLGGVHRGYCTEDGTERMCIYPVSAAGYRTFEPFDSTFTLGEKKTVVVPKGGIFVLGNGSVTVKGQNFKAPHVLVAQSGDLTIAATSTVYGVAAWRL